MSTELREIVPEVPEGLEFGLRNYWYPILQSEQLGTRKPIGTTVLGENLVVWRDADGKPGVLYDRCAHRAAKLSVGRVLNGNLQCIFHGLRYDTTGQCILVPWEAEDSATLKEIKVRSYPAQELGGYIWAYMGDAAAYPPPPLESEVPEELLHPDEYLWFRMPTAVWNANWLISIDGSDAFHAVTLHAETQAVSDEQWEGGAAHVAEVPLEDRRVKIVQGSYGIRAVSTDKQGNPIHHGHLLEVRGDRFILPAISSNPIRPVPGVPAYVSRLWQYAQDEKHTIVQRYIVQRAVTEEEREKWTKLFEDVVKPRITNIGEEDAMMAEAQGDLVSARAQEYLFEPDMDMFEVRRTIRDAYAAPFEEGKRIPVSKESLVYPVVESSRAA